MQNIWNWGGGKEQRLPELGLSHLDVSLHGLFTTSVNDLSYACCSVLEALSAETTIKHLERNLHEIELR